MQPIQLVHASAVLACGVALAAAPAVADGIETATVIEPGAGLAQQEANKDVVLAYVDAFNRGDLEALKGLFAPDAQIQGVLGAGQVERIAPIWEQLISGLGIQLTIEEMVAEDDRVAVRYTERGVFQGPFFGHQPTGKSYELVAMEWFVIRDGKILRRWGARDAASQARQIGLPLEG